MIKIRSLFVVEVGALLNFTSTGSRYSAPCRQIGFGLQITLWLWFTVLFANFAEAMAEGRGKAKRRRPAQGEGGDRCASLAPGWLHGISTSSKLRAGDEVLVSAGEFIPGDGEVIEGVASVDESRITGESAPVIRESGGDRSAVNGRHARSVRSYSRTDYFESGGNFSGPHDSAGGRCLAQKTRMRIALIFYWQA